MDDHGLTASLNGLFHALYMQFDCAVCLDR